MVRLKIYAGIGARATPVSIQAQMKRIAKTLDQTGWKLLTGGADGADTAFASGASAPTIYIPWARYNGHEQSVFHSQAAEEIAKAHHPAWHRCSRAARLLHARNAAIILGDTLNQPANAVICWTPRAEVIGGTGLAMRIARSHHIPIYNLAHFTQEQVLALMNEHANTR